MSLSQKIAELLSKSEIQLGTVKFNQEVCISNVFDSKIVDKFKNLIEKHCSIVTSDSISIEHSNFRLFTSRASDQLKEWPPLPGSAEHIKFISKLISEHNNILMFPRSQYLVTSPVYRVKKELISVVDDSKGELLVDFFEKNREEILQAISLNSSYSVRFIEFLEKIN